MRPDDLQQFIAELERAGELTRVKCRADPHLEIAAVVDLLCKGSGGGPALLFERVAGHSIPLAVNLYGSRRRLALALGIQSSKEWAEKLRKDLAATGARDSRLAFEKIVSQRQERDACTESPPCWKIDCTDQGVSALPALQAWPGDGGRYLTLGQVFTCDPESLVGNCGMYRLQVVDRHRLLLRCHAGSGGARHLAAWHANGEAMPIAVALGGPPIMTWLAGVSLPGGVTELAFASYLTGRSLPVQRCQDPRLSVPASAEIVLEGRVWPGDEMLEGPFGNHTGRYQPAASAPVIRIERMYRRKEAIYPCTVVGPPPMENACLAEMTERILLPLLQFDHPWVQDLHMPPQGVFHRAALVAVAADCPVSVAEIRHALWASALLRDARLLILLDADVCLHDFADVYWRVVNAVDWATHCRADAQRLVVDARAPKGTRRVVADAETVRRIKARWGEYGLGGALLPPRESGAE